LRRPAADWRRRRCAHVIKTRLLSIPPSLAVRLVGLRQPSEGQMLVHDAIVSALTELSSLEVRLAPQAEAETARAG
jgi:hypothetical protein